jgi:GT2 family glycosyltransferase
VVTRQILPVYLVHYDQPDWCAMAVRSIRSSIDVVVDLTVIDNGSPNHDSLDAFLDTDTRIISMENNRGFTGAANAALRDWFSRYPDGDYCVIGSHDLHVDPDALARLVALAREHPEAGILAPALVAPDQAAGGTWSNGAAKQYRIDDCVEVIDCQWASGTCLLLNRACVEHVGPFDERLGSYCEDVDYGLRATDRGWKVLVLTSAHARGLGSSSESVLGLRPANTVLLNAKRDGLRAAVRVYLRFLAEALRGYLASVMVWRERERRARARRVSTRRAFALLQLIRQGTLFDMLRHPEDDGWHDSQG